MAGGAWGSEPSRREGVPRRLAAPGDPDKYNVSHQSIDFFMILRAAPAIAATPGCTRRRSVVMA